MMRLSCPSCGIEIELPPRYEDYNGKIGCESCSSIIDVEIKRGKVKEAVKDRRLSLA